MLPVDGKGFFLFPWMPDAVDYCEVVTLVTLRMSLLTGGAFQFQFHMFHFNPETSD